MKNNVVYKISKISGKKKIVFSSGDLIECLDFVLSIARKERLKLKGEQEKELQNFLDFGVMNEK